MDTEAPSTQKDVSIWRITFLAILFCGAMALMNVIIEHAEHNVRTLDATTLGIGLTLGQFFFCFLSALLCGGQVFAKTASSEENLLKENAKTFLPYVSLAVLIFCGTGFANIAVGYVQYPVMVVFKSSKLVPVMLVSGIMGNSRTYSIKDYMAAMLICFGTVGFAWNAGRDDSTSNMVYVGIALLVSALAADALSSNMQQKMMQQEAVDPMTMMARLNFVGFVGILAFQTISGEASQILKGAMQEPMILMYIAAVGLSLSIGAWANTNLINEAGAVFTICVATLRKALTIMLSYIIFPKPLTYIHIVSAILLAAGLTLSDLMSDVKKSEKHEKDENARLLPHQSSPKV
eukprot:gnl/MRDRNA2_/MRDRNA2_27861_c0_seq1.p1 gnl/MRDRNA2_/MRDRNA2_27861_c0~~gnl/MRDRNA2_/MRDRNA2_27861_c0_seq1.p1  ORF type:complete len:348 (+),score=46.10 gnl/MRDRNA2_/MRDRNA2_27861_c0_seq1:116-1159(+)